MAVRRLSSLSKNTPTCPCAEAMSASGVPVKRILPRSMTISWLHTDWTSSMMWVDKRTILSCAVREKKLRK